MSLLSDQGIGPKLVVRFENGRFEQFLEGATTLDTQLMRDLAPQIANALCEVHGVVKMFPAKSPKAELWTRLHAWADALYDAIFDSDMRSKVAFLTEEKVGRLGLRNLHRDIDALEASIQVPSPVVFTHGDVRAGPGL